MVVDLDCLTIKQITAGLCISVVISLWHVSYRCLSSSQDIRVIQRACGDSVVSLYLTREGYEEEDFHVSDSLAGLGMYDFVRLLAAPLFDFLPAIGQNQLFEFPRGNP